MKYQSICNKFGHLPFFIAQGVFLSAERFDGAAIGIGGTAGLGLAVAAEAIIKFSGLMRNVSLSRGSIYLQRIQVSCVIGGVLVGCAFQYGSSVANFVMAKTAPAKSEQSSKIGQEALAARIELLARKSGFSLPLTRPVFQPQVPCGTDLAR